MAAPRLIQHMIAIGANVAISLRDDLGWYRQVLPDNDASIELYNFFFFELRTFAFGAGVYVPSYISHVRFTLL
ncbi:hypothetical protein GI364_13800 [Alicyclobacillus sp. SO9]|nr:hypothetical protein GI364_13800 [Alicyclobacillus sp. SO9]